MFTVSSQMNVYSIPNNWCICINISCGNVAARGLSRSDLRGSLQTCWRTPDLNFEMNRKEEEKEKRRACEYYRGLLPQR